MQKVKLSGWFAANPVTRLLKLHLSDIRIIEHENTRFVRYYSMHYVMV